MILWGPYILFTILSSITPGPNNIMLTVMGANYGFKKSIPALMGIILGFMLMALIVDFGLAATIKKYPILMHSISLFGISYLLYLAYRIAFSGPQKDSEHRSKRIGFWMAFGFQWVNPKSWIAQLIAFSSYTTGHISLFEIAVFVTAAGFLALPCCTIWLVFGTKIRKYIQQPKHAFIFNASLATLLVLCIVIPLYETLRFFAHYFFG